MSRFVFSFGRRSRWLLLGLIYAAILVAAAWFAFEVRFDFRVGERFGYVRNMVIVPMVLCQLIALIVARQFGTLLSYFSLPDLLRLVVAMSITAVLFFVFPLKAVDTDEMIIPRGVILINFALAVGGLSAFRIGLRVYHERYRRSRTDRSRGLLRLAIVGAGDVGATLAKEMLSVPAHGFRPVLFFDDDVNKHGKIIHGVPVAGKPEDIERIAEKVSFSHAVIAMPSASSRRVSEVINIMSRAGRKVEIVPSLQELAAGRVKVSRIRPVDVQDLLGREPVDLDGEQIRKMIANRVVLVTGAGGSIGSELCRQIVSHNPRRLLMAEQSEGALFLIEQELLRTGTATSVVTPLVADILDRGRMDEIFARFRPSLVFHAAAHKHVFMMERQPGEAVKNNSMATACLADVAIAHGVEQFVFISTDKAINPTNVMGATKRLAELNLLERQHRPEVKTRFSAVRFGNVLGSSGSVVPIFRQQIAAGGPVTVTHPEVTRYFMTIPEAVGLVLQASTLGKGGEIFVLDMGEPVKIIDLARQMILLSGLRPDEDIEIRYTGLKPGEKLYEELQHFTEALQPTSHPRIRSLVAPAEGACLQKEIYAVLQSKLNKASANEIKEILQNLVPEYSPFLD
ncbi:MAG: polysaccharide biosynthesis protein [Opitutales bacterium]|nr:polysaccharide biosynthesis protein [Opitutales bacterium]